jgi:hypothetical protein
VARRGDVSSAESVPRETVTNGTEIRVISDKNLVLDFDLDLDVVLDLDSRGPTAGPRTVQLQMLPSTKVQVEVQVEVQVRQEVHLILVPFGTVTSVPRAKHLKAGAAIAEAAGLSPR